MAEQPPKSPQAVPVHQAVQRLFEQGPDAISFYTDFAQVINTGNEVVFQFYETIPGPPGPNGQILNVRTRLRATVQLNITHALNLANNILGQAKQPQAISGA